MALQAPQLRRPLGTDTIILWTDADTYPIADLTPLYEQCRKDGGIMLFAAEGWCKGDGRSDSCMKAMACDTESTGDRSTRRLGSCSSNWQLPRETVPDGVADLLA